MNLEARLLEKPRWRRSMVVGVFRIVAGVLVLAFCFAQVEIQIEGSSGWAASLPTWRVEHHPLLEIFWGGRPLTGYHAWVFLFMALVFHWPYAAGLPPSWGMEARILGSLMIFWIVEDFLWFLLNPAFGWSRFHPEAIPWHRHWCLGVPTDYVVFLIAGGAMLTWSFWRSVRVVSKSADAGFVVDSAGSSP